MINSIIDRLKITAEAILWQRKQIIVSTEERRYSKNETKFRKRVDKMWGFKIDNNTIILN